MAHQAHSIPWHIVADNFEFIHWNPHFYGSTNLYLRNKPEMGKQLGHFTRVFARALADYSVIERKKYDADPAIPDLDEIIISEDAVKRMSKTVQQYKTEFPARSSPDDVLSLYKRTARLFVDETTASEGDMHNSLFDVCEQTKTMIMYGEMDTLFRLATHPRVWFGRLWDEDQYANSHGFGLSRLKESALLAYICLNVLFLKPELYDPVSRMNFIEEETKAHRQTLSPDLYDYRLTAAYQHMLLYCTAVPYGAKRWESHTYPHREFFGIPRGMFEYVYSNTYQKQNLGREPVSKLVHTEFKGGYVPGKSDIPLVLNLLGRKGLPAELALHVMDIAGYTPVGRTHVRDDPLHISNGEELKKYLSYCWKILVRIDMLCKENGRWLDWEVEVTDALYTLFEIEPGMSTTRHWDWGGDNWESDISLRRSKRAFR
ncbi:hypothetical protein EJ04DRAFT_507071 [Polyplosphaeria fusca]|uniref:Uncharacterized protein n=1 Tax=Polyplosphaeria fusca TaxID=682080 RepID=A0A9P4RCY2_9PLEO|nr:hypothetical protein EJ04DRAFT_507071 [Polyplosphaeria fusca]